MATRKDRKGKKKAYNKGEKTASEGNAAETAEGIVGVWMPWSLAVYADGRYEGCAFIHGTRMLLHGLHGVYMTKAAEPHEFWERVIESQLQVGQADFQFGICPRGEWIVCLTQ